MIISTLKLHAAAHIQKHVKKETCTLQIIALELKYENISISINILNIHQEKDRHLW